MHIYQPRIYLSIILSCTCMLGYIAAHLHTTVSSQSNTIAIVIMRLTASIKLEILIVSHKLNEVFQKFQRNVTSEISEIFQSL